ncbi:hypothetical protein AOLI_G00068480 [Acnodon oligacanthus]
MSICVTEVSILAGRRRRLVLIARWRGVGTMQLGTKLKSELPPLHIADLQAYHLLEDRQPSVQFSLSQLRKHHRLLVSPHF